MTEQAARTALAGRIHAVLNTGSGSVNAASPAKMTQIFTDAGLPHAEIVVAAPKDIEAVLAKAMQEADVVVVLGGDGTIRTAAHGCGACGKLLVPLPGGTMNMLPHALYGAKTWPKVLAQVLARPRVQVVSGGRIGKESFYCAAILGSPSLWADAREAVRHGHLIEAVKRSAVALEHSGEPLAYDFGNGETGEAQALAVICPLVSRAMVADAPSLEVAALEPATASGVFSLAYHAVFDDWRRDPSVSLARVKAIEVSAEGRLPAILDGEKVRLGRSARVVFRPMAFRALVPQRRGAGALAGPRTSRAG
ncbi:diacylglycerol/lipid kinase family protein [Caulobacter sp. KR2-114]|uniref:diacylglycerol/lipid kinase family protein n=1 Tax=Caulobacter sp. KR2-114 TaxID=3400912 RepID=UPI003C0899DF